MSTHPHLLSYLVGSSSHVIHCRVKQPFCVISTYNIRPPTRPTRIVFFRRDPNFSASSGSRVSVVRVVESRFLLQLNVFMFAITLYNFNFNNQLFIIT